MKLKDRGGVWYAVGKVGGQLHRVSTTIRVGGRKERDAALRRMSEIELKIRAGDFGWENTCPTVREYWEQTYRPTYSLRKRAPERDDQVMAHALPVFGAMRLDAVKKSDCEKYLNARRGAVQMNPKRKTPGTIAEGTVQRERSFLTALFNQAIADTIIDANPWKGVERHAYEVRDRLLTSEEQTRLLAALSPRFQRFVLFVLGTGVRLDEARGIDPACDLHLGERFVTVTGKFGKTRDVPLRTAVVRILEQQLTAEGKLWTQNPQRLREVLADGAKRAKIDHLSPHTLRHTFGWRFLQGGGHIYTLSKILGHASVAVTEKHYAHLLKEDLRTMADSVDVGVAAPEIAEVGKVLAFPNGEIEGA